MSDKRVYEGLRPLTQAEALAKLATRDSVSVSDALVAVGLYEPDYEFAAAMILGESKDSDGLIRGAALIALAHLARVHRKIPDAAIEIIGDALRDTDAYVRGQAETAADDIEQFIPKRSDRFRE